MKHRLLAMVVSCGIVIAACGSDDDAAEPAASEPSAPAATSTIASPVASAETSTDSSTAASEATSSNTEPDQTTATSDAVSAPQGGTVTVALLNAAWSTLDPMNPQILGDQNPLEAAIFDTLFRLEPDGRIEPRIATGYEFDEEQKTFTVTIREGVKFHDGSDLTAEVVAANLRYHIETPTDQDVTLAAVREVEADGQDVILSLDYIDATLPAQFAYIDIAWIVHPDQIGTGAAGSAPIGAGPFKFVSQIPGAEVILEANDDYWGGRPNIDQLIFRNFGDEQQVVNAINSGEVDFFHQAPIRAVDQAEAAGLEVQQPGATGFKYITFNVTTEPFSDLRARKAVAHAIDQESIVETLFGGRVDAMQSPLPPQTWWGEGITGDSYPAYDVDAAKALVEELGGLSFTFNYAPNNAEVAEALHRMFTDAGMSVTLEQLDKGNVFGRYRDKGYTALIFEYASQIDPQNALKTLTTTTGNYTGGYSNPAVDDLVLRGADTVDEAARREVYAELADIYAEDLPMVYVGSVANFAITSDRLEGVEPNDRPTFEKAYVTE